MAHVISGGVASLPGESWQIPEGTMCDDHPDRPAVRRVQGETDSMGCELNDMCQECLDKYKDEVKNADTSGTCEWCKTHAGKLRPRRDYEEGLYGRVYQVCEPCIDKQSARLAQEAAQEDDEPYYPEDEEADAIREAEFYKDVGDGYDEAEL